MVELSSEELFNSAISDERIEDIELPPEGGTEVDTRARDESGRFVAVTEQPEPKPEATQETQAKPAAEQTESAGVRQLREAFERSERRRLEMERELLALRPRPEAPPKPDMFEKPDEFVRMNVQEAITPLEQRYATLVETFSRKDAIREHGEARVTEAFGALDQAAKAGDPQAMAVVQAVKQSMDPFGDIVNWYRGAEASRNPDAFFQRRLDEALKDDKFKGELLTKLQPAATEQPAKPVFKLPPSIGRVPSAQSASDEIGDLSDSSLFAHAMR